MNMDTERTVAEDYTGYEFEKYDEKDDVIHTSSEWGSFMMNPFNRNIEKINKLMASMKKWGFLMEKPIMVMKLKNSQYKYLIKDGHRRWSVASTLRIPIYYITIDPYNSPSLVEYEKTKKPWNMKNWLQGGCRKGIPEYVTLDAYCRATGIPITCAIAMFSGETAGSNTFDRSFKDGLFKIRDVDHPDAVAEIIAACKNAHFKYWNNSSWVTAVSMVLKVHYVDHARLLHNIKIYKKDLLNLQAPNMKNCLQGLEDVYNYSKHNTGEAKPLAFDVVNGAKRITDKAIEGGRVATKKPNLTKKHTHTPTLHGE